MLAAALRSDSDSVAVACSAFSMSVGYAGSCMPMDSVNLYFHSSNVAELLSYVGGFSFSLCTVASASVPAGSVDAAAACGSAIVLRVPHTTLVGIKLSSVVVRLCCLGCYPVALFVVELSLNVSRLVVVLRYHEKLHPVVYTHFCLLGSNCCKAQGPDVTCSSDAC